MDAAFDEDPDRSEFDKLVAGDWFRYRHAGPELAERTAATQAACRAINEIYPKSPRRANELMHDLLDACGHNLDFRPPIYMDYGERVRIGDNVFINTGLLILGGGLVTIGSDCLIGPDVRLYTPNHAMDPHVRREGWERALPITLGSNVWIGGSVVVCPGVTIGDNAVVGAGSVVTKDIPPGVLAAGNPARVIRSLAEH